MRHNCGRVVRIFFETAKEIRSRQRLSGFDLPVCNFLRIGIDDRGSCRITRIARIAGRKTSSLSRSVSALGVTRAARQIHVRWRANISCHRHSIIAARSLLCLLLEKNSEEPTL